MTRAELEQMLAGLDDAQIEEFYASLNDSERAEIDGILGAEQEKSFGDKAKEFGLGALQTAGKALDYAGGVARTAAAAPLLEEVGLSDVISAIGANPLTGEEILKRAGLPEGGQLSDILPQLYSETGEGLALKKGGMLDPSGRGAAGLALELATDPLTYLTLGATKTGGKLLEKGGRRYFEKGLKNVDRALELSGKDAKEFSRVAEKFGLAGSAETIEEGASQLVEKLAARQQAILREATERGATIDAGRVLKRPLLKAQRLAGGKNIKPVRDAAEGVKNTIEDIVSFGSERVDPLMSSTVRQSPLTPLEASGVKSQLYGLLGDQAYSTLARDKAGQKLFKDTARGLKTAVESSIGKVDPKLARELKETNRDLGALLSSRKVLARETNKEVVRNALTPVDAALAAAAPGPAIAKKAGDFLFKNTAVQTRGGLAGIRAGQALQNMRFNPYAALTQATAPRVLRDINEGDQ